MPDHYEGMARAKIDRLVAELMGWELKSIGVTAAAAWFVGPAGPYAWTNRGPNAWSPTTRPDHCALVKRRLRKWAREERVGYPCSLVETTSPVSDGVWVEYRTSSIWVSYEGALSADLDCCLAWCILALRVENARKAPRAGDGGNDG